MISTNNIQKNYGKESVLKDIDVSLASGKLTAFIGPNGAGKSTLLAIMSRLLEQSTGDICLKEKELKSWKQKELAKELAVLKQQNNIPINISVKELVSFGRFPYQRGKLSTKDQEIINDAIKTMGLEPLIDKCISEISGGQLQRAYIALILAQDTDVILLDEPLNNLDMNYAVSIMQFLQKLAHEKNKTIAIVIHDINFAASYADEIVAMKDGQLFKTGSTEEVIQKEVLSELYDMPIRICNIEGRRFCLYY